MKRIGVVIALICAAPVWAGVAEDEVLKEKMTASVIAAAIDKDCRRLQVSRTGSAKLAQAIVTRMSEQGYDQSELAVLQDPAYLAELNVAAGAYLAEQGVDISDSKALCAYGKEILKSGASPVAPLIERK